MNRIIALLLGSICLISTSSTMDKLNITSLSNTSNYIDVQMQQINNINNDLTKKHKHKVRYKYNKHKHHHNNIKYFNVNSDVTENIVSFQNMLTNDIHSEKFKMLGNIIHKQIMDSNKEELFKKFNINNEVLNQYKFFYSHLINIIKRHGSNYNDIIRDANDLTIYIYILLNDNVINAQSNIDYVKRIIWNRNISSEKKLYGNNILKVVASLSNAIADWSKCANESAITFLSSNKNKDNIHKTANEQLQYIKEIFGI
ncbi:MAG: hypothetical protein IJ848_02110 [Alphaproteobacteria bacterium]|nr:hypothetical protein [Alphaproteobacteria bacterium]